MPPIHNGQPVDEAITNPAFLDAQEDDTAYGRITLANSDPSSGPTVPNAQAAHNASFQDVKMFLATADNSKVGFASGQISFTADLLIVSRDYGIINRILASASPIALADGESLYVTLNRLANQTCVPNVTAVLPKGSGVFRVATRMGDGVIFWPNILIMDGRQARLGSADQFSVTSEVPTMSDPTSGSITRQPVDDSSFWVLIDGLKVPNAKVTRTGMNFTLDPAYAVDVTTQEIEVLFMVEGSPGGGGGGGGGGGAFSVSGSPLLPLTVDPTIGILISSDQRQMRFVKSMTGAQPITANPQISSGSTVGQELVLVGVSNTDYLTIADGAGLALNGSMDLKQDSTIWLTWNGLKWVEIARK